MRFGIEVAVERRWLAALHLTAAFTTGSFALDAGAAECAGRYLDVSAVLECVAELSKISNATLDGQSVIEALQRAAGSVRIDGSKIVGGLDFSRLDTVRLATELHRRSARSAPAAALRGSGMYKSRERGLLVAVKLEITNSTVGTLGKRDDRGEPLSISAGKTVFIDRLDLKGTRLEGGARFSRAAFLDKARFEGTRFGGRATFDGAWFAGDASFKGASFDGATLFTYVRVARDLGLREASFAGVALFDAARVCRDVHLGASSFAEQAELRQFRVAGNLYLQRAAFKRRLDLTDAEIGGTADVTRVSAEASITLASARIGALRMGSRGQSTRLRAEVDFSGARVGTLALRRVTFLDEVSFLGAVLGAHPSFPTLYADRHGSEDPRTLRSAARVGCEGEDRPVDPARTEGAGSGRAWSVSFERVVFRAPASFVNARFLGRTSLRQTTFLDRADLSRIRFDARGAEPNEALLRVSDVGFESARLRWNVFPPIERWTRDPGDQRLSEVLSEIEERLRELRRLHEALQVRRTKEWARIRESAECLEVDREERSPDSSVNACASASRAVRLVDLGVRSAWGVLSGFGTSWTRLVGWILVTDLAFALVYMVFGHVRREATEAVNADPAVKLRILELPTSFLARSREAGETREEGRFANALRLSTVVLLRVGPMDVRVSGRLGPLSMATVVTVEWCLGLFLIAALLFTLSESQPFIQRLLSGAFG
jgi:hypothetical protein